MIKIQGLTFNYKGGKIFHYPDFRCTKGEALLIKGKSGCGKTTLLHLIAGILQPQSGDVVIDGTSLSTLKGVAADQFRGQHIGFILQRFHFIDAISVEDNIRAAAYFSGKKVDDNYLLQLSKTLGIKDLLSRKPKSLSLGEQQRVSIARAVINRPSIVLADEPTSSLDDDNCMEVVQLLKDTATQNESALIVVTHDERLKKVFTHQISLT
jgi:putative ABC transport system ATP-binding protein